MLNPVIIDVLYQAPTNPGVYFKYLDTGGLFIIGAGKAGIIHRPEDPVKWFLLYLYYFEICDASFFIPTPPRPTVGLIIQGYSIGW